MSESTEPAMHLIIIEGPDAGREISIPSGGARMGRVSGNDIVFDDPSMSRFQCRMVFKEQLLWINDLGSTNESLVNDRPVQEAAMKMGDLITLGQTVLRVARIASADVDAATAERLMAEQAGAAVAKTQVAKAPDASPAPAGGSPGGASVDSGQIVVKSDGSIDLGLRPADEEDQPRDTRKGAPKLLWMAVVIFALIAGGLVITKVLFNEEGGKTRTSINRTSAKAAPLQIYLEEVRGDAENITRYEVSLAGKQLNLTIDDMAFEKHHVNDPVKVSDQIIEKLKNDLESSGFFKLQEKYDSIIKSRYNTLDITIIAGSKIHRVRVKNANLPRELKAARDLIVEFSEVETGMIGWDKTPEELKEIAQQEFDVAKKLEREINVRDGNTYKAWLHYSNVERTLKGLDPKPSIYADAVVKVDEMKSQLEQKLLDLRFESDQALRAKQWPMAAKLLRTIKETMPDRDDPRHVKANRDLISVERKMN